MQKGMAGHMKNALVVVILVAVGAMASDLTGTWSGTFKVEGGDHATPQLFILKQDRNRLTGSGGPDAEEQYPIEHASIDGERVRFELTTGEWQFTYNLKQRGRDGLTEVWNSRASTIGGRQKYR
jgi:hypothetical protein